MLRFSISSFLLCVYLLTQGLGVEIKIRPESVNATQGSNALFRCLGKGIFIIWNINGATLNENILKTMSIEHSDEYDNSTMIVSSNISILASNYSNNSHIYCVVVEDGTKNNQSNTVTLRVQGLLSAVGNLKAQYSVPESILTWTAPYSLAGIDTYYQVSLADESTGVGSPVITIYDTSYKFNTTDLVACRTYLFSIQAWNDAGGGNITILKKFFSGGPSAPLVDSVNIDRLELDVMDGNVEAVLAFPVTSTCFSNQNISIQVTYNGGETASSVSYIDKEIVTIFLYSLPVDKLLFIHLLLSNTFGEAFISGIKLNTYTLQELKVIESLPNGTTCFQCNFLTNSQSSACYVILKPDTHTLVCTNVSRLFERSFFREYTNGSIDSDVAKGCVDDVYTNLYDIEAYSVSNISSILDEPDIKIENVTLDGITYTTCKTSSVNIGSISVTSPAAVTTTRSTPLNTPSVGVNETNSTANIQTAGILIGAFGGVVVLILVIMLSVFIYRKRQTKQGMLTITQDSLDSPSIGVEMINEVHDRSQTPSVSSIKLYEHVSVTPTHQYLTPTNDITQERTTEEKEEYVLMHSASIHSQSTNASTSSNNHIGVPKHDSGDYDHLKSDEDVIKENPLDLLVRDSSEKYCLEQEHLNNEHLV